MITKNEIFDIATYRKKHNITVRQLLYGLTQMALPYAPRTYVMWAKTGRCPKTVIDVLTEFHSSFWDGVKIKCTTAVHRPRFKNKH
jgi:hypothetical protein